MKKEMAKKVQKETNVMLGEYDFKRGVRGKHYRALQAGYTITVHNADGSTTVKDVMPKEGAVILDPEVLAYFPDSESVNKTLRCIIPLLPRKHRAKSKRS